MGPLLLPVFFVVLLLSRATTDCNPVRDPRITSSADVGDAGGSCVVTVVPAARCAIHDFNIMTCHGSGASASKSTKLYIKIDPQK